MQLGCEVQLHIRTGSTNGSDAKRKSSTTYNQTAREMKVRLLPRSQYRSLTILGLNLVLTAMV